MARGNKFYASAFVQANWSYKGHGLLKEESLKKERLVYKEIGAYFKNYHYLRM